MHAIQLMEIGKCFSLCSATEAALRNGPPPKACQEYWLESRHRNEHWTTRIQEHRLALTDMGISAKVRKWQEIAPLLQEILLTEPLARCIAHHALVLETLGVETELAFLAKSVLDAHLESRHRCLHLLIFGNGIPSEIVRRLNHIRLACETYSDMLQSLMPTATALQGKCEALSFQPQVTSEIHQAIRVSASPDSLVRFQAKCLSDWFLRDCALELDYQVVSARYNTRIAASLLAMLPANSFDSLGMHRTAQSARMSYPSTESASLAPKSTSENEFEELLKYDLMNSSTDLEGETEPEKRKPFSSPLDLLAEPSENMRPETRSLSRRWS